MKKLFALAAVALTLCGLLTACGSKTETANDVDLTGFYNALAEKYGWGDDMMDLDGEMLEMYYPGQAASGQGPCDVLRRERVCVPASRQ